MEIMKKALVITLLLVFVLGASFVYGFEKDPLSIDNPTLETPDENEEELLFQLKILEYSYKINGEQANIGMTYTLSKDDKVSVMVLVQSPLGAEAITDVYVVFSDLKEVSAQANCEPVDHLWFDSDKLQDVKMLEQCKETLA
jgi:hypothetical protein